MELGLENLSKFFETLESNLAKSVRKLFTKLCEKKYLCKTALLNIFEKKIVKSIGIWRYTVHTL